MNPSLSPRCMTMGRFQMEMLKGLPQTASSDPAHCQDLDKCQPMNPGLEFICDDIINHSNLGQIEKHKYINSVEYLSSH